MFDVTLCYGWFVGSLCVCVKHDDNETLLLSLHSVVILWNLECSTLLTRHQTLVPSLPHLHAALSRAAYVCNACTRCMLVYERTVCTQCIFISMSGAAVGSDLAQVDSNQWVITGEDEHRLFYVPFRDYAGSDSFAYQVIDEEGAASASALCSITVRAVNDPPVAQAVALLVEEGSFKDFSLSEVRRAFMCVRDLCVCVCIHVCMYTCMFMYFYMFVCLYACIYVCI